MADEPVVSDDVRNGNAGDVIARDVTIKQGGARSIAAESVVIRQGGAAHVRAEQVTIAQGGVGFANTDRLDATGSAVLAVISTDVELSQTAAQVIATRESAGLDQSAAAVVVAGEVTARDSAIGLVITPRFEGEGNRVLFGPATAFAFGAGVGLVMLLARMLRRRSD